jgi:hypothetical protein
MKEGILMKKYSIGGADGPTSVFVTGKLKEQSLKTRIRNDIYRDINVKKWRRQ